VDTFTTRALKGKHTVESFAKQFEVKIKRYHADNAPFGANEFRSDISNQDHELTFSGAGAHHQNGVAERSIRTVTQWASAMLLHLILRWPEVADLKLWPFALDHAPSLCVLKKTQFQSYCTRFQVHCTITG
jgi:hypothetical protein